MYMLSSGIASHFVSSSAYLDMFMELKGGAAGRHAEIYQSHRVIFKGGPNQVLWHGHGSSVWTNSKDKR